MRKHNTMIKQIYNSKGFNPEEKRQLIDGLYQNMIDISKLALEMINDRQ